YNTKLPRMIGIAESFFAPQTRSLTVLLYKSGIYDIFIKYIPGDTLYTRRFYFLRSSFGRNIVP
ncbi:MAG: hypothetical protein ABS900_03940, partial [Candidatus Limivicinus sp.]